MNLERQNRDRTILVLQNAMLPRGKSSGLAFVHHCEKAKRQKHTERIRESNALKNLVRGQMAEHSVGVTRKRDCDSIGDYSEGDRKTRFLILSFGMCGRVLPGSA